MILGDAAAEFDDSEEKVEEHIEGKAKVRFLDELEDSAERTDMVTIQVRRKDGIERRTQREREGQIVR